MCRLVGCDDDEQSELELQSRFTTAATARASRCPGSSTTTYTSSTLGCHWLAISGSEVELERINSGPPLSAAGPQGTKTPLDSFMSVISDRAGAASARPHCGPIKFQNPKSSYNLITHNTSSTSTTRPFLRSFPPLKTSTISSKCFASPSPPPPEPCAPPPPRCLLPSLCFVLSSAQ